MNEKKSGFKGKVGTLVSGVKALPRLVKKEIWQASAFQKGKATDAFYRFLRIIAIVGSGIFDNRILQQAAALSYYSLIGLGPLVAIGIMISSFVLERSDSEVDIANETLNRVLLFIAPPAAEWSRLDSAEENGENGDADMPAGLEAEPEINPALVDLLDNLILSARSGTVGLFGSLILIIIVIQLFTSIEQSFNSIWGVKRGRSVVERVVFYWSLISLGAVLGFASIILLSASTIARHVDRLQLGIPWLDWSLLLGPGLSFAILILLLASFNRFIPNTSVYWKPALVGAAVSALLLFANHFLSFLYVQRVITAQSLYGSVGIIPVLMIGLYVFWLIVLVGGQITYATQNADNLTNRSAWDNISGHTREILSLACLVLVGRRFRNCEAPYSAGDLANALRVPARLLNSSLTRLVEVGWLAPVEGNDSQSSKDVRYQPGRPLDKITLGDFKRMFENYGNNSGAQIVYEVDPVLQYYREQTETSVGAEWTRRTIDDLIDEMPAKAD
jgi:membrane protein